MPAGAGQAVDDMARTVLHRPDPYHPALFEVTAEAKGLPDRGRSPFEDVVITAHPHRY